MSLGAGDRRIVAIWVFWSAMVLLLASLATRLPVMESEHWAREPLKSYRPVPLARWDAGWYYLVATEGYRYDRSVPHNTVGFYPLYPLVLRGAAAVLPGVSLFWLGIGVSLLSLLPALLVIARLAARWGGSDSPLSSVAALLLFPTSFFFASVYTESVFLLATATAIWAARCDRWALAGAAGAAAALTRLPGALILLPLVTIAWTSSGRLPRLAPRKWAAIATVFAGACAYPAYLWARFGDPLLYIHEKTSPHWAPKLNAPWTTAWRVAAELWGRLRDPGAGRRLLFYSAAACLVGFLALSILLLRRGLVAEGLYCGATLLLLLASGTLEGIQRYVLVLFPCFFLLAEELRRRPALAFAYAFGGAGVGTVFLHRFVHLIYTT